MTVTANPYLQGNSAPGARGGDRDRAGGHRPGARSPSVAATCGMARIRSRRARPAAYHWFTGDGHGPRYPPPPRGGPSGTGTAGSVPPRWRERLDEAPARARCTPRWTSPPTRTSSAMPVAPSPSSRRALVPTSSPTTSPPSVRRDFGGTLAGGYTAHPKRDPLHWRAPRRLLLLRMGGPWARCTVLGAQAAAYRVVDVDHGRPGEHARHAPSRSASPSSRPSGHLQPGGGPAGAPLPVPLASQLPRPGSACCPRDGDRPEASWYDVDPATCSIR